MLQRYQIVVLVDAGSQGGGIIGFNMNKWSSSEVLRFHLKEVQDDLTLLRADLENEEMDNVELYIRIAHLYHHMNSAWNSRRYDSLDNPELLLEQRFMELSEFPKDLEPWGIPSDEELEE